jgi:hypothetical protein
MPWQRADQTLPVDVPTGMQLARVESLTNQASAPSCYLKEAVKNVRSVTKNLLNGRSRDRLLVGA